MFSRASAIRAGPDGGSVVEIDPGWFQGPGACGGYSDQESLLFTPSGRLLAISRQMVAVVR